MASMNYFNSYMSNSTNTVVHFNGKDINLYLYSEGKVTHNLCSAGWLFNLSTCQILADYNASTHAFSMGKS